MTEFDKKGDLVQKMARQSLMDDSGYRGFDECANCESCTDKFITELLESYDVDSIEELVTNAYNKGRVDAIKWHYFKDNDFPPNEHEDYLYCRKIPSCEVVGCDEFEECDEFDEHCKNYFFSYDVESGRREAYSDGMEIAWCELPRVAEELKEQKG